MEVKNTDLMSETVKKYLSGELTYKEAMDIIYPLHLENMKKLEEIISERKNK